MNAGVLDHAKNRNTSKRNILVRMDMNDLETAELISGSMQGSNPMKN